MNKPVGFQTYTAANGIAPSKQFFFPQIPRDPSVYDIGYDLYQGWVNTATGAIWYLESLATQSGTITALWRAVGPIVLKDATSPTSSDYLYPIGQTWVNQTANSYWVLVDVTLTTATWIQISGGAGNGIDSITGNSGGPVFGSATNNVNLLGTTGQIVVTGNPGTNTLTLSLTGGGEAIDSINVDTFTGPGTNPVLPAANGSITVTGAQVGAGTTTNVIRTDSLAVNAYTIQIQRSQAVASTTVGDNGVSHFDSAKFTVDSNAFVSTIAGAGFSIIQTVFATSGTYTPTTGMKYAQIQIVGGGGAGGGAVASGAGLCSIGSGGGGGAYASAYLSAATIGASQTVTIGAGGIGVVGGTGGSGGTTSLGGLFSIPGGTGGAASPAAAVVNSLGGLGGTAVGVIPGSSGAPGFGNGATGPLVSGNGGDSHFGAGGLGVVGGAGTGLPGTIYGGGGSGSISYGNGDGSARAGANGAAGFIFVTEYIFV